MMTGLLKRDQKKVLIGTSAELLAGEKQNLFGVTLMNLTLSGNTVILLVINTIKQTPTNGRIGIWMITIRNSKHGKLISIE